MKYKDIEPFLKTRQLLGWTENLWKNQSGELWFVDEKDRYGLCFVNSEFRKDDIKGQCPSLHKTELENIWDNEIQCTALVWYIYAHANLDFDIEDEKLMDIIKDYLGCIYFIDCRNDLVYIQDNFYHIASLLDYFELTIGDFLQWLYRVFMELNICRGFFTNLNDDETSNKCPKNNCFFNTQILFSPTSEDEYKYTLNGYPYTHILYHFPHIFDESPKKSYVEWILYYSPAVENKLDIYKTRKMVANMFPSVLLTYVAEESRKKIIGTENDWAFGRIDFKSRDFIWAIYNQIDVSKLSFRVDGRKLYDAYLKATFEIYKEYLSRMPGREFVSDDAMWKALYKAEITNWREDQPLKDILPEDIYTEYAKYVEAYFAYFRRIHPCVCEEAQLPANSSNPQTKQLVEKTEDEKQDDKGTEPNVTSSSSSFLWPQYTPQATEEDKRDFERFLTRLCTGNTKSMTHDIQTFLVNKVKENIIKRPSQKNIEYQWVRQFGYPYTEKTYYNA